MDENGSGQKAKSKSVGLVRKFDFCDKISVIEGMPVGVDPADYVAKNGLESFLSLEKTLSDKDIRKMLSLSK